MSDWKEMEVIVHPIDGMQLSAGTISRAEDHRFVGRLPGMAVSIGESIDDVLGCMDRFVKAFYGDDTVVELVHGPAAA